MFLLLLAIAQIATTFLFLHPMEVASGQKTVEIAWQANNMDALQQNYECCGKTSAQDYVHLNQVIPPSCYADLKQSSDHLFLKGCIEEVQSQYDSDKRRFLIVSWVLVGFEVSTIDWHRNKEYQMPAHLIFLIAVKHSPSLQLLTCALAIFLAISFRNKQRRMQF